MHGAKTHQFFQQQAMHKVASTLSLPDLLLPRPPASQPTRLLQLLIGVVSPVVVVGVPLQPAPMVLSPMAQRLQESSIDCEWCVCVQLIRVEETSSGTMNFVHVPDGLDGAVACSIGPAGSAIFADLKICHRQSMPWKAVLRFVLASRTRNTIKVMDDCYVFTSIFSVCDLASYEGLFKPSPQLHQLASLARADPKVQTFSSVPFTAHAAPSLPSPTYPPSYVIVVVRTDTGKQQLVILARNVDPLLFCLFV